MEKYYSYSEVFLKPRYSQFYHRRECSTLTAIGSRAFRLPIVPANMKCVIDSERAKWLSENEYFYIMHRFGTETSAGNEQKVDDDNYNFISVANHEKWKNVSISVGVHQRDKDRLKWCVENNYRIDYITIDIAHGHCIAMREMLEFIHGLNFKSKESYHAAGMMYSSVPLSYKPYIIAGNVCTKDGVIALANWGADMIKVGIAQGEACTTYGKTGFGSPMFSTILECSNHKKDYAIPPANAGEETYFTNYQKIPILADGGIRTNGDIAKAIVAGASLVMAGGLFAATKDSPSQNVHVIEEYRSGDGSVRERKKITHKVYYGSASEYNTHSSHHIEGTRIELPVDRWNYAEKLVELEEDLQSSIAYSGGDLSKCEWGIRDA